MTKILTTEMLTTALIEHDNFQSKMCTKKYQLKSLNETCFDDVKQRMYTIPMKFANKTHGVQDIDEVDQTAIKDMILNERFIPAGSILSGLGNTEYKCSLSNCYLGSIDHDSLEGIFDANKRLGRTYSYRGGSGLDLTILRPNEAPVNNAAITSSGAVSFMPLCDKTTEVVGQNGRRGALAMFIDIRHPDTIPFIWAKADPERVFGKDMLTGKIPDIYNSNISLKVIDAFMEAVEEDRDWDFIFPSRSKITGSAVTDRYVDRNYVNIQLHPKVASIIEQLLVEDPTMVVELNGETFVDVVIKDHFLIIHDPIATVGDVAEIQLIHLTSNSRIVDTTVYDTLWNGDYDLWQYEYNLPVDVYSTVKAKDVLYQIAQASHKCGDPGIIFITTGQEYTPGTAIDMYRLKPTGINPCGEQILPKDGNCMLACQVWYKYVINPYTSEARFDIDAFLNDTRLQVMYLNIIHEINIEKHPLERQRVMDRYSKRIGIEVTGIGDTFAMLNMMYGDEQSLAFIEDIMHKKAIVEIATSMEIAKELGAAPALNTIPARQRFIECAYIDRLQLPDKLKEGIMQYGLRNTAFNTIGPAGSISILADNCTSGIEPLMWFNYERKTRMDNEVSEFIHGPVLKWLEQPEQTNMLNKYTLEELKTKLNYIEAHEINSLQRIKIQSLLQKYCDTSISSTINLPITATVEEIYSIYIQAWKHKLKGVTIFRDGCKDGIYAEVKTTDTGTIINQVDGTVTVTTLNPAERILLDIECANRHRVMWKGAKLYVIVSIDEDNNPVEIFTKIPKEVGIGKNGHYNEQLFHEVNSIWDALTRSISLSLRHGIDLEKVIKQLDKSSHAMVDAPGIIARVLRSYIKNGLSDEEIVEHNLGQKCASCGEMTYVIEGGCGVCRSCGYSRC